jgi:hypothetical protein
MDMTDTVYFELPEGIVATAEAKLIDIGVKLNNVYHAIFHSYTVIDNKVFITWNTDSEFFRDLSRAHYVSFNFYINATFDGTKDQVSFGDSLQTQVDVDTSGSVTGTFAVRGPVGGARKRTV